ncbi:MAG: hypothetical protein WC959_05390 [Kiritimatiellales bacterium]
MMFICQKKTPFKFRFKCHFKIAFGCLLEWLGVITLFVWGVPVEELDDFSSRSEKEPAQ